MRAAAIALCGTALLLVACGQGGEGNVAANVAGEDANAAAAGAPSGNLAAVLGADQRFAGLIEAAGMTKVLEGKDPYTVLAPSAEALNALPAGTLERLQQPDARAELTGLLRRHILPGTILSADLARAVESGGGKAMLATMAGDPLTVTRDGEGLRVEGAGRTSARLVGGEQPASNGVVHRIDAVLPAPTRSPAATN